MIQLVGWALPTILPLVGSAHPTQTVPESSSRKAHNDTKITKKKQLKFLLCDLCVFVIFALIPLLRPLRVSALHFLLISPSVCPPPYAPPNSRNITTLRRT